MGEHHFLEDFKVIVCFGSDIYLEKVQKSFKATGAQVINGYTIKDLTE